MLTNVWPGALDVCRKTINLWRSEAEIYVRQRLLSLRERRKGSGVKLIIFCLGGILALALGTGCSHTQLKSDETRATSSAEEVTQTPTQIREVAGLLETGLVDDGGAALLFYKQIHAKDGKPNDDNDLLIIQSCMNGEVNSPQDCKTSLKSPIVKMSVKHFKARLKMILSVPEDGNPLFIDGRVGQFQNGAKNEGSMDLLERQRSALQATITQFEKLIASGEQVDPERMQKMRAGLQDIENRLEGDSEVSVATREINQLIVNLVDQIIGGADVHKFVFSKDETGFEFNLLRSFFRKPMISADFVKIPSGSFQIGSPVFERGRGSDENLFTATIDKEFEIQTTEVTQEQWFWVMGYNVSAFRKKNHCPEVDAYREINGTSLCLKHPVENVSWPEIEEFIKRLNSANDGYRYRLPTEREWEFAARGGQQTPYSFGENVEELKDHAWYDENSFQQTHAVAKKKANPFKLYDMHGNVWEWVGSWYAPYSKDDQTGFLNEPKSGTHRVLRGGGWAVGSRFLRSAIRSAWKPTSHDRNVGFRLVRTPK